MKIKMMTGSIVILAVLILAGCGPAFNSGVIPSDQLGTAIVETSAALATQTALFAPPTNLIPAASSLPTMTSTPLPSLTPLSTNTPFLIIIPSKTATTIPTRTMTATPIASKTPNQPCAVAGQLPPNNTSFSAGAFFDTVWTLMNTGTVTWVKGNVDFAFVSGAKMYLNGISVIDLPATTAPNQSVALTVHMQAPLVKGTYTDTWNLREGNTIYCTASVTIIVK